jgi:hypothetical protein
MLIYRLESGNTLPYVPVIVSCVGLHVYLRCETWLQREQTWNNVKKRELKSLLQTADIFREREAQKRDTMTGA